MVVLPLSGRSARYSWSSARADAPTSILYLQCSSAHDTTKLPKPLEVGGPQTIPHQAIEGLFSVCVEPRRRSLVRSHTQPGGLYWRARPLEITRGWSYIALRFVAHPPGTSSIIVVCVINRLLFFVRHVIPPSPTGGQSINQAAGNRCILFFSETVVLKIAGGYIHEVNAMSK
ncbi:unnamed protein product [Ectocarpus sp. 12 AP-2014]